MNYNSDQKSGKANTYERTNGVLGVSLAGSGSLFASSLSVDEKRPRIHGYELGLQNLVKLRILEE